MTKIHKESKNKLIILHHLQSVSWLIRNRWCCLTPLRRSVSSASTVLLPEVGFGMPSLASFLPVPAGPGLVVIQSEADAAGAQQFCLDKTPLADGVSWNSESWKFFFVWK